MKRDQLKELGLDEKQIENVIAINGADIQREKTKSAEALTELDGLRQQISERDKDLKTLKGQVKDNEALTEQLKELKSKYEADTADLQGKISGLKLTSALDTALNSAKVRNTKAIKGLLDMDVIKLDETGQLTGLKEQLESIQKTDPYLFDQGTKQDYKPETGASVEHKSLSDMTILERAEMFKNDPDGYNNLLNH